MCALGGFCVPIMAGVTNWGMVQGTRLLPLKPCKGRAIWLILYWLCSGTEPARVLISVHKKVLINQLTMRPREKPAY
jgi:hypothetical protein